MSHDLLSRSRGTTDWKDELAASNEDDGAGVTANQAGVMVGLKVLGVLVTSEQSVVVLDSSSLSPDVLHWSCPRPVVLACLV